jgi:internalin A
MNRLMLLSLVLGLPIWVASAWAAEPNPKQAKAIVEIKKLGGKVTLDEKSPGKPVMGADLMDTQVTDEGLKCLRALHRLQDLNLYYLYYTNVGDAGLEHVKGLTELQFLNLWGTKVTDAGMGHVKGFRQLETLQFGTATRRKAKRASQVTQGVGSGLEPVSQSSLRDFRDCATETPALKVLGY